MPHSLFRGLIWLPMMASRVIALSNVISGHFSKVQPLVGNAELCSDMKPDIRCGWSTQKEHAWVVLDLCEW